MRLYATVLSTANPLLPVSEFPWTVAVAGVAVVVCTALGVRAARAGGGWPHWAGLVSGLGRAAFLLGLVGGLAPLAEGLETVARAGASVTGPDVAGGLAVAAGRLVAGALVALLGLAGCGVVRLCGRDYRAETISPRQ